MLVNICINLHILFGLLLDAQSKFSKHANGFVAHCSFLTEGRKCKASACACAVSEGRAHGRELGCMAGSGHTGAVGTV